MGDNFRSHALNFPTSLHDPHPTRGGGGRLVPLPPACVAFQTSDSVPNLVFTVSGRAS